MADRISPDPGHTRDPLVLLRMGVGLTAMLAIVASATTYSVREGSSTLVTRLGDPVAVVDDAGLHFRLPWPIDQATPVDRRRRVFETGHTEMLTRDKKNVLLVSFAVWRVVDPLRFYQSTGSVEAAEEKLDGLVTNAQIGVLGRYDLSALTSTNPDDLQVEAIEEELLAGTAPTANAEYGIEIQSIGLARLSLPEENVAAVFKQMRAERKQFAARYQAEGDQEAARIRSEADLEATRIRAEGKQQAAAIRGEAEAEAARIYAEAHRQDPDLYKFVRSLESLEDVVGDQTTVILRTDSDPFRLLTSQGR